LLGHVSQVQNAWDVLLLCYEFASREIHRFFNESMLPPRAQPGPRKAEWREMANELATSLRLLLDDPLPKDLAFDDDARDELHAMLAEPERPIEERDEVMVVAALAEAISQLAPEYELLRQTTWRDGEPLNRAFLDRYEVHPVRLSSPLRTLLFVTAETAASASEVAPAASASTAPATDRVDATAPPVEARRPLQPVTERAQRGLYPDALFPGHVFVPVAGSRYRLEMRPTDWSNRWLQSSRRPGRATSLSALLRIRPARVEHAFG
jgi:hypothetical protein